MKTTIGENIKLMCRKCGFTQEELANMLAVTPQAISKWENGNGTPDISQLIPLSQIFGITTDTLLGVVSATYGDAHTAAAQLIIIAENYVQIAKSGKKYKDSEEASADAHAAISLALNLIDKNLRDKVCASPNYTKALQLIENILV